MKSGVNMLSANRQPTLWQRIDARCQQTPDKIFLRDEHGKCLTFANYHAAAERYASWLQSLGIGCNSRVAWQLPTNLQSVIVAAALCRLGAVQVPILPFLREREVGFICQQSRVDLLLLPDVWGGFDYAEMGEALLQHNANLRLQVMPADSAIDGVDALAEYIAPAAPEHVSWIFYTSGTTSDPKGARHCDDAILSTAFGMVAALELCGEDVVPMVFPFTHIGGVVWLASLVLCGGEALLLERFSEDKFASMAAAGISVAGAGTTFIQAYLKVQRQQPEQPLFPRLRCATGGGSTKPPQLHAQVKAELGGVGMVSGYGMTECPIATMGTVRDPDDRLAATEGRAMPGMLVKIVNADGERLNAGEQGEICLKGPHLCLGYIDSELDKTAFDSEGYLRSGDLGVLDSDGWLTVTGRLKDVIIRKGENISAKKVEDAIAAHPVVAEVTVVGVPDDERGELACAVIVLRAGCEGFDLGELANHCLQQGLLKQECPERIEFVDEIPRNASGKVVKQRLLSLLTA